jgi:cytochrome P450
MQVDLEAPESISNPTAYFARIRQGGDVQWSEAQRAWIILGHAQVESGFRDSETISADRTGAFARMAASRSPAFLQVTELLSGWMNFRDPPVHTRLREPVRAAFTPRAVDRLETDVRNIVESVLDDFDEDIVDLSAAFARPIPAFVIAALMGVDGGERHRFTGWSDDLTKMVFAVSPGLVDEPRVTRATAEISEFFSALIEREQREPTGSLLTAIVQHHAGTLSPMELVGACMLLLFGGHETTTTLLTNALAILFERPDLREWLREHPEHGATAFDEFMRVAGPARSMARKVGVDHVRCGQDLRAGQSIFLAIASANHDPAVFPDPATIDLQRDPNPHMGFGWGLHYCLGANLARMEARIALDLLLNRFPRMELAKPLPTVRASAMGFGRRPIEVRLNR